MNIVNKLTLRQLKLNKRRTLVTILGAIISVAMVTAVAVSAASGIDLIRRVAISTNGNWHMRYHNIKSQDISVLEQDENIGETIIDYPIGYAKLEQPKNSNKPYLFVRAYNAAGFELMPIELVEGQLPKNSKEIVIPEYLAKSTGLDYKIGDQITLNLGQRYEKVQTSQDEDETDLAPISQNYGVIRKEDGEVGEVLVAEQTKTYTVVGIIKKSIGEYSWSPGYELISYTNQEEIPDDVYVTVSVLLKDLTQNIYEHNATLGLQLGVGVVEPHSELLATYGANSDSSLIFALWNVVVIVIVIIMAGSVSLIYNAFAISVAERAQYLGMLASVGATKKQKRVSVFFEGIAIGSISIPLGLLAGFLGMAITFSFINNMLKDVMSIQENLKLVVVPWVIVLKILVSALTIFISTYIPARRASRISPMEAIRQTADIKMNQKKIRTSKLTRKIFGFEGELALKNLKRNGRRYRATLLSLVISIILFLTTATFSAYMTKALDMMLQATNYDIRVTTPYQSDVASEEALEKLKDLEKVEDYNLVLYSI